MELKNNIKQRWWRDMVHGREDVVGLDSSIIASPKVWEASGHVAGFVDPMVDCKVSKLRYRADQLFYAKARFILFACGWMPNSPIHPPVKPRSLHSMCHTGGAAGRRRGGGLRLDARLGGPARGRGEAGGQAG